MSARYSTLALSAAILASVVTLGQGCVTNIDCAPTEFCYRALAGDTEDSSEATCFPIETCPANLSGGCALDFPEFSACQKFDDATATGICQRHCSTDADCAATDWCYTSADGVSSCNERCTGVDDTTCRSTETCAAVETNFVCLPTTATAEEPECTSAGDCGDFADAWTCTDGVCEQIACDVDPAAVEPCNCDTTTFECVECLTAENCVDTVANSDDVAANWQCINQACGPVECVAAADCVTTVNPNEVEWNCNTGLCEHIPATVDPVGPVPCDPSVTPTICSEDLTCSSFGLIEPNGFCSRVCDTENLCMTTGTNAQSCVNGSCVELCDPSLVDECPTGWSCVPEGEVAVCLPTCATSADCVADTYTCDSTLLVCVSTTVTLPVEPVDPQTGCQNTLSQNIKIENIKADDNIHIRINSGELRRNMLNDITDSIPSVEDL